MPDDFPVPLGPYLNGRVEHVEGVATLALAGELDMAAIGAAHALLNELEAARPRAIVVDLQALTFLDSSRSRVLVDAHKRSLGAWAFVILNGSGAAHRALTVAGLDQVLTMVSSVDELREELAAEDAETSG